MTEIQKPAKKKIPFIEILKHAARIVWQNRFLLWFGLLLALGSPSSFNIGRNNNEISNQENAARNFLESHWQIIVIAVLFLFAIGIALFLISLVAKAGLVKSINILNQNKKTNFKEGWRSGKKYLGKLLGIFVLVFLAVIIIVAPLQRASEFLHRVVPLSFLIHEVAIPILYASVLFLEVLQTHAQHKFPFPQQSGCSKPLMPLLLRAQ